MTKSKDTDAADAATTGKPILIKKYPNRRLYNTDTSCYIVLEDVIALVKAGTPFVIEDKKSGEDITRTILNQIIFEQEVKPSDFHFPLEFQKQLIAMYGDSYGQMVPDYLTESLKLFTAERSRMGDAFESAMDHNTRTMMDFSEKLAQQNMDMFRQSWSMFTVPSPSTTDASDPKQDISSDDRANTLENIQSQIDALQERLKSLK